MRSHLLSAIRARWLLPAWRARRGGVAILVAVTLVVLIGFVSLGTEVVALLMTQRQMQAAADSAALAAATARTQGYPAYANEAVALARDAGFVNGATNPAVTVAVNGPPLTGAYAGNTAAVQVVITQVQPMLLSALSHNASYTLTARAVGLTGEPGACALALRTSGSQAILMENGFQTHLDTCGIASNSSSGSAILLQGGADLFASWLNVVGNYSKSNDATLNISGATRTSATAVANPYAARVVPTPAGTCINQSFNGGNVTLPTGTNTYCSMALTNVNTTTLSGGIYIVKDNDFTMSGSSTMTGTGTIVLAGTGTGSSIGSVTISNNSVINLTAPTTGVTAGMVLWQDIRAPNTDTNIFASGAGAITLNGAVYFPNQAVNFWSGGSTASVCTQLIARSINFTGNTTLKANCAGRGTLSVGGAAGRLVE